MIDQDIRVQRTQLSDLVCSLDQWTEDYVFAACVQSDDFILGDALSDTDELGVYFDQRYEANGRIQLLRVLAALRWVNEHWEHLDAKYGTLGDKNFRVKKELVSALYSAFAMCPEEDLETDFSASWVLGFDTWKAALEEATAPADVSKSGETWKQQPAQVGTINEAVVEERSDELGESTKSLVAEPTPAEIEDLDAELEAALEARKKILERVRALAAVFRKKAYEGSRGAYTDPENAILQKGDFEV